MQDFSTRVLAWYDVYGRKHLPWQAPGNPNYIYYTWVSEIMLQQTQVTTVIPYFNAFIARFPDVNALAIADSDEVMALWAGLGYYARARHLHQAAKIIHNDYQGRFPDTFDSLQALPGIGRSTAGAILSLALGQRHAILDGNVKRVLCRHARVAGHPSQAKVSQALWRLAENYTPNERCASYTQAMMDLGATVCTRTKPKCHQCPVQVDCQARIDGCVSEYPSKKTKKALPLKQVIFWLVTDNTRVYLEKRPDTGIWGGLWGLPESPVEVEVEAQAEAQTEAQTEAQAEAQAEAQTEATVNQLIADKLDALLDTLSVSLLMVEKKALLQHAFTHYRLQIHPVLVTVDALPQGVLIEALTVTSQNKTVDVAMPTPVAKLIEKLANGLLG
ncbi:A/G-specific adenine glycosylase [Ostreibacterium oceani]|uniref:Adenine DNA glycosylase n=1 Tax=Ostreibacterium oceani TaxID=2654998 RepID=A0A6N7EVG4_9GAMM|nr:A/G-specific adenine glycosylase [Ostreibacterium oceani]MPV85953.1 A/G-specific adenine glycosylase [Ostreibacterium oceani]